MGELKTILWLGVDVRLTSEQAKALLDELEQKDKRIVEQQIKALEEFILPMPWSSRFIAIRTVKQKGLDFIEQLRKGGE